MKPDRTRWLAAGLLLAALLRVPLAPCASGAEQPPAQRAVPLVERMPAVPQPFRIIDWKARARDLYETTTGRFLARGVQGTAEFTVGADAAVVIVVAPAGGKVEFRDKKMLVDGVIVDHSPPAKP